MLDSYSRTDMYPFHMPGHKRNFASSPFGLPYSVDITEIDGFDNLHDPHEILMKSRLKAKELFGSKYSYLLVNGSTCGILAAVFSAANHGDEIIIARNCHKSVYNACSLNDLDIHYIYPGQDGGSGVCCDIKPESVLEALSLHPQSKAVVITSPTYEGVISDVKAIAEIAHRFSVPLIVDNAHGSHQRFCRLSREGEPIECGADIVISSLHKTLPSLTQTSCANLGGDIIDHKAFEKYLSIFQTSSPSYVLMASMDYCFDFLRESRSSFEEYCRRLEAFGERMRKLKNLRVLCYGNDSKRNHGFFGFDLGKIVIVTSRTDISGVQLSRILREQYSIELEMAYMYYAVAMTSVCDTAEGFDRLANALTEIDASLEYRGAPLTITEMPKPQRAAGDTPKDMIAKDYIYAYPPGIPIVVPGEIIDRETEAYIKRLKDSGVTVVSG